MTNTTATKTTRWIDKVARSYDDDSRASLNLANLHAVLMDADELAIELTDLVDCGGDCGSYGYGNDPDRTPCECGLGDVYAIKATRAADAIAGWVQRINPLNLYSGMDMHLYTRALRVWQQLVSIREGDLLSDVRDAGEEIRGELA